MKITQSSALMEIYLPPKRKKTEGKSQGKKQTSYIERKVLTITLLMVFVPESTAEMLK